jgi:hypothetical protein
LQYLICLEVIREYTDGQTEWWSHKLRFTLVLPFTVGGRPNDIYVQTKASGYLADEAAGPCVDRVIQHNSSPRLEKYTTVIVNTIYLFILSIYVQQNLKNDCK